MLNVYKINIYFAKPSGMLQISKKKKTSWKNYDYNIETVIKINVYDNVLN